MDLANQLTAVANDQVLPAACKVAAVLLHTRVCFSETNIGLTYR